MVSTTLSCAWTSWATAGAIRTACVCALFRNEKAIPRRRQRNEMKYNKRSRSRVLTLSVLTLLTFSLDIAFDPACAPGCS
ncbi:hypothetical protein EXIGLDRAFT_133096 [Exidia glandulosa HHB12029]|uniref:Uncharacterized protein n=1 Tax=Exidia glandulosa HHB12029 TaxID=1314781 RepID=A0A165NF48_EXIGL|nr:hypothetical protein EXIGLDRAFT_133096 [Exidia glandulosa HHB12029]